MEKIITKRQKAYMMNPFIQFFRFIFLNIKIIGIVAGGHGGTRKKQPSN
jgi:hypothetical protein